MDSHTEATVGRDPSWVDARVFVNGKEIPATGFVVTPRPWANGPLPPLSDSAYPPDAVLLWPGAAGPDNVTELETYTKPVVDLGESIEQEANKHIGKRYEHGQAGPWSFDCSGFTFYVVKRATGRSLPRSSYEYNRLPLSLAIPVRGTVMVGDILLFDSEGNGSIGHVGIMRRDGKMVNALNPGRGVVVSDPNSDYFRRIYMGAVRVV